MMTNPEDPSIVSRRGVLKAAGWAAGTLLAAPILSTHNLAASPLSFLSSTSRALETQQLRIGVLVPVSTVYPALGDNLMAGMRLYFAQEEAQAGAGLVDVLLEQIGLGLGSTVRKARKLLETDGVDLVVGVVSPSVAARLGNLFAEHRKLLVVSNLGANVPRSDERNPYIFYSSLGLWQANWALGAWAATNLGDRAFVAASFYDSGYDALYAFHHGFEASGGQVLQTYVTHTPTTDDDLGSLLAAVNEANPDFVYACYCGQLAVDFVRAYAGSSLTKRFPLLGSGFLVNDELLPAQGKAARGIKTCLSWTSTLDTPECNAFSAAYQRRTGRQPDAFAVLGYDTAQVIWSAANAVQGTAGQGDGLRSALGSVSFVGPRGAMRMNPATQSATSPLYLQEVRQRGRVLRNVLVSALESTGQVDEQIQTMKLGTKTGWLNAYLGV